MPGHLKVGTTCGYLAVFEEDVVRHYQVHLARRRTMRPAEEYRPATAAVERLFRELARRRIIVFLGSFHTDGFRPAR